MEVKLIGKDKYMDMVNLYAICFDDGCNKIDLNYFKDNIYGMFDCDKLIGMAQIDYIYDFFRGVKISYINSFCIHPDYRNMGNGNKLLNSIIDICKSNNCNYIMLTSNSKRVIANKMYLDNNFYKVDTNLFRLDI